MSILFLAYFLAEKGFDYDNWWSLFAIMIVRQWSSWSVVFQGNSISTTKYNVLTFLPKGLFEQVLWSLVFVELAMFLYQNYLKCSCSFTYYINFLSYILKQFYDKTYSSGGLLICTFSWFQSYLLHRSGNLLESLI